MAKHEKEKAEDDTTVVDTADSPFLDTSNAAVKRLLKKAKKRGFVTQDELNAVLPPDVNTSDQIEDITAMLSEMGINVIDQEPLDDEEEDTDTDTDLDDDDTETGTDLVEASHGGAVAVRSSDGADRTDDPVRLYLREMGAVELLSREGEIAIAKRIEAGREAMIAGLCESPLTFQAIIIWRDELIEGKIFLRDIIDLEATYAEPDGKKTPKIDMTEPENAEALAAKIAARASPTIITRQDPPRTSREKKAAQKIRPQILSMKTISKIPSPSQRWRPI